MGLQNIEADALRRTNLRMGVGLNPNHRITTGARSAETHFESVARVFAHWCRAGTAPFLESGTHANPGERACYRVKPEVTAS